MLIIAVIAVAVIIIVYLYFLLNKAVEEPRNKNRPREGEEAE